MKINEMRQEIAHSHHHERVNHTDRDDAFYEHINRRKMEKNAPRIRIAKAIFGREFRQNIDDFAFDLYLQTRL